jgi:signal transduction histidine kinase
LIESLKSQGSTFQGHDEIRLPPHPQGIEIAYTALSLTIPERVRFRYRLEGIDKDWQDPGSRRSAFYTHLPVGVYHFKVIASNNDGVWNEQGAEVEFSIAPAFYETWSFKVALGILAVVFILWGVRSRIGQIRRQLEARLAERLSERERIARELHDTLLQDFQAAILQFHLVRSRLRDEAARAALDRGLDYADHALLEGRDRIRGIRDDSDTFRELSELLSKYGEEMAKLWPLSFAMSLAGEPFEIDVRTRDEIYQIGHEAICNAFKHSEGSSVRVETLYGRDTFRMRISDDGVGMEPGLFEKGRAGHWGMIHMHERAQKIGARLEVRSEKDRGTTLELTLELRNRRHIWRTWFLRVSKSGAIAST